MRGQPRTKYEVKDPAAYFDINRQADGTFLVEAQAGKLVLTGEETIALMIFFVGQLDGAAGTPKGEAGPFMRSAAQLMGWGEFAR